MERCARYSSTRVNKQAVICSNLFVQLCCNRHSERLAVQTESYPHTAGLSADVCSKWKEGRKEGNVLFNDTLNTFYLRFYGVRHMVKDNSDSERKHAAATWATLSDQLQGCFYMHHPTDRITRTTAFVTPVSEHWLEREIAQWVHQEGSIR